jgi:hypothetical protein
MDGRQAAARRRRAEKASLTGTTAPNDAPETFNRFELSDAIPLAVDFR